MIHAISEGSLIIVRQFNLQFVEEGLGYNAALFPRFNII